MFRGYYTLAFTVLAIGAVLTYGTTVSWLADLFAFGAFLVAVVGFSGFMASLMPTWEERSKCQHCGEKHDERPNRTCQ